MIELLAQPIMGLIGIAIVGGVALLATGLFLGSQIDDKIEQPTNPIEQPIKTSILSIVKWPLVLGAAVFTFIVAKKWAKKL